MARVAVEYPATGRRKTAVASVRLRPGSGSISINERSVDEYFPRMSARTLVRQPLTLTGSADRFDIVAQVKGGGISAQATALRHALSRALVLAAAENKLPLKKAGFLTRDPREVERKKYGRHKARKRPQYSKR
jgi:small subunit ribosomal protein S9